MDLHLLIPPGTTSLDAQIFSFDDDLELKSANYDLRAKLAPGLFICHQDSCQEKQLSRKNMRQCEADGRAQNQCGRGAFGGV